MDKNRPKEYSLKARKIKRNVPLYLKLNGPHTRDTLNHIQHNCFTGLNCFEGASIANWRSYPEFCIGYPVPIYTSTQSPNKIDICHQRTRENSNYLRNIRRYHTFYKHYEKKKHFRKAMKKGLYPHLVLRFAELLELKPDPYFSGRYDWYYTGGNLEVLSDQNIVLHTTGDRLDTLVVSEIVNNSNRLTLKPNITRTETDEHPEIFEIQTIQSSPTVVFSLRKKHRIILYTYDEGDLQHKCSISQEIVPYISSASDPNQIDNFVTSDFEKTVRLWDVTKSTAKSVQTLFTSSNEIGNKENNWTCLRYFTRDTYAFAGINGVSLLDRRVPLKNNTHTFGSVENSTEFCERISSMCVSSFENLLYLGSSHKMLAIDMRYLGKEIEDEYVVIRWTHQMDMSPLILRNYLRENTEYIFSTSSISGDVRCYENIYNEDNKFTSPCLPFMPPTLLDAYNSAKHRGKCNDPTASLKNRIDFSTSGMCIYKYNNDLFNLLSNSNGDVFSQKISFDAKRDPSEEENFDMMEQWEEEVLERAKNSNIELHVTKVESLSGMSKVFRCKRLDKANIDEEVVRVPRLLRWQKPIEKLRQFKDALASDLLAIWDIDEDQKPAIDLAVGEDKLEVSNLVEQWLNGTKTDVPMVSISANTFESITLNETRPNFHESASDYSGNAIKRLSQAKSKSQAKVSRKSKYVQGF